MLHEVRAPGVPGDRVRRPDLVGTPGRDPARTVLSYGGAKNDSRPRRRPDVTELEIFGGPETDKLLLVEHDPAWATVFEHHRGRVLEVLGDTALAVHHVGSTSVPGLMAKPIVDMLLLVDDVTAEEDHVDRLVEAGYVLRVRDPGHRMLRTPERDVHLHVHEPDHPESTDLLLFRDRLRSHPGDRDLYEATKRALIKQPWTHMQAYADAKGPVVEEIKARARREASA